MSSSLSPSSSSPKVKRKQSTKRPRAYSHLPPFSQETHDVALYAIRTYLKGRTSYDSFPVSYRLTVLDAKLEVRKALQCLLINGKSYHITLIFFLVSCFNPHSLCHIPLLLFPQVLCPPRYGTAKLPNLLGCSPFSTSSISFNITTNSPRTIALPLM